MVELHVVCEANRNLYSSELDEYFRARHSVYVVERGWKELDRGAGREIDQFDTPHTIYLMAIENSRVVGGHRLVPTTEPTMLSTVFPELVLRGNIRRSDVYELSRIFVVRDRRGEQARPQIESVVLAGTMEFGLAERMNQFTIVMETWWIQRLAEIGWQVKPLGLPINIKGMITVGVAVDVSESAWAQTCVRRSVRGSVLVWNGLNPPSIRVPVPRRAVRQF